MINSTLNFFFSKWNNTIHVTLPLKRTMNDIDIITHHFSFVLFIKVRWAYQTHLKHSNYIPTKNVYQTFQRKRLSFNLVNLSNSCLYGKYIHMKMIRIKNNMCHVVFELSENKCWAVNKCHFFFGSFTWEKFPCWFFYVYCKINWKLYFYDVILPHENYDCCLT